MGAVHDQVIDTFDHLANNVDLVVEVTDQVQRHQGNTAAAAVDHHSPRPQPVIVTGRLSIGPEPGHVDRVAVIHRFRLAELLLISGRQGRAHRRDIALAGPDRKITLGRGTHRAGESENSEQERQWAGPPDWCEELIPEHGLLPVAKYSTVDKPSPDYG